MNLREFTEAADRETKEMSREELWLLVHSLVRRMPEEEREEFLDLIGRARKKETEDGGSTSDIDVLAREKDREDIHELLTRLEGQEMFWESWIRLLTDKPGDTAGGYLEKAVLFQCTEDEMIEAAHKAAPLHPGLYLAVVEKLAENDAARALDTGRSALKEIDARYKIRGNIALATAEAALKMGERELAEQCWLEAFRSDTTAVNYLRNAAECEEPERYRKELMQAIHSCQAFSNDSGSRNSDYGNGFESYRETSRNSMDDRERFLLCFLSGDFDAAMEKCAEMKKGLGWTGHVIKSGLPLFLLLLLQNGTLPAGCREQLREVAFEMGFQKKDYEKGLYKESDSQEKSAGHEDVDILEEAFSKWKARHVISEEQAQKYLAQLNRLVDMRVKAIVSGQHRGHYGSVAALAAALGEVRESRGELSAKNQILLNYRAEFPRHSSFHAELRAYGMPDTRKR